MQRFWIALALATAACTPPASAPDSQASAQAAGPYANSWDAAEYSRFEHVLQASEPGAHALVLQAQSDAPGGETVAVYPMGADGTRSGGRLVFVVATAAGRSARETVEIPAAGLPVQVVVENAGGRRHAGSYTLTVE